MKLSIIIPTYNAGKDVKNLITGLDSQRLKPFEVIVIDSSSTDGSLAEWNLDYHKTFVIDKRDFDHAATRNLGASKAQGDILVFMTQDAIPANEHLLEHLTAPIRNGSCAASFSRQTPKDDANALEVFAREFNYPLQSQRKTKADIPHLGVKAFFFSNVCSAIKKEIFDRVGGFPDSTIVNEDMLVASKLLNSGYAIEYIAEAEVLHSHNYSIKQQFQRSFDIGVALTQAKTMLTTEKTSQEGLKFVYGQLRHVNSVGQPWLMPRVVVEAGARYIAFKLGTFEKWLPKTLKRSLSMHNYYWS